jgi:5-formyltetrahydrofolate cyclo-ligase
MKDLRAQKQNLRQVMRDVRRKAFAENPEAGAALCTQVLDHFTLPQKAIVAASIPFGGEIDVTPLMEALREKGHTIVLPVISAEGEALIFRQHQAGEPLAANMLGILEPLSSAPMLEPDILFIPLLAFDLRLHRLGYGGGYYDRTLQRLRAGKSIVAVGLGFSAQEIPEVPRDAHDARLDKIFTENQAFEG